jgi:hypothetical protein
MAEACPDCGEEFQRVNQHLAMSDCEGKGAKITLTCEECGSQFEEYEYRVNSDRERDGIKYCSQDCHAAALRNGKTVPCDYCGEQSYHPRSRIEANEHHFCSKECESEWRSDFQSGESNPRYDGGNEAVSCEQCGEEYEVKPAKVDTSRFCSTGCRNEAQRNELVTRSCSRCGDEITRKSHEFTGDEAFCGTACLSQYLSRTRRGSDNPAWKGGKSLVTRVRSALGSGSWGQISAEQRAAADYECEMCGATSDGRRLSVHHIIPLATGGTHGDWNLMVLCNSCHRKIENVTRKFTEPHLFAPLSDSSTGG